MMPPLEELLHELRQSPLVLHEQVGSGANDNLWSLTILDADRDQLAAFLHAARLVRTAQAAEMAGPAVFYVWHDAQAGQLRFSVARGTPRVLPFAALVEPARDVLEIVDAFLASFHPDGSMRWSEPQGVDAAGGELHANPRIKVWATQISAVAGGP